MQSRKRLAWAWIAGVALATVPAYGQESGTPSGGADKLKPGKPREGAKPQDPSDKPSKEQGTGKPDEEGKKPAERRDGGLFGGSSFLFIMIGGFVLLYFLMSRGRRKQEAKRREMLSALKKGDKITTIGGVVGTIMDVREDEVTVKVDETNNIRVRFARWAIRGTGAAAKAEKPEDKK